MTKPNLLLTQPIDLHGFRIDSAGRTRLETLLGVSECNEAAGPLLDHIDGSALLRDRRGALYDQDYSSDYINFYAMAFKDYPRRTKRIHFFARDVSDIFQAAISEQIDALASETSYLGFTVVRPIRQAPIGRTHSEISGP